MLHGSGAGRVARRRARRGACALLAALVLATVTGCKDKKKEEPLNLAPPPGAASSDELTTAVGQARGLSASDAPSSARWQRVLVLDDKRAVLLGEVETEAIALITDNAGRTWRSLRRVREGWSTWSVDASGALVMAMGPLRAQAARDPRRDAGADAPAPAFLTFAAPDAAELSAASQLALPELRPGMQPPVGIVPAALSAEQAAVIVEEAPRRAVLVYGGLPGADPIPPLRFPPRERALPVPYGRPPTVLSTQGSDLLIRPIPAPGKPLDPPRKVAGLKLTPAALSALSEPPACEHRGASFQLVPQPGDKTAVLAVSSAKASTFLLPSKAAPKAALGCSEGQVTAEIIDQNGQSTVALCSVDGRCVLPEKPPFRPWIEPHEQWIVSTPTRDGVVAVMTARAGPRWGLYIAEAPEHGKIYEVARVIGEGMGDRGRIDLGALLSFGNRLVMLLQADVTGTSRRGWYVTVSEDGGLTWNLP